VVAQSIRPVRAAVALLLAVSATVGVQAFSQVAHATGSHQLTVTVTGSATHPIVGNDTQVILFDRDGNTPSGGQLTTTDGVANFDDIAAGDYAIEVIPNNGDALQWSGGTTYRAAPSTQWLTLTAATTASVPLTLKAGGSFSGTVKKSGGGLLQNATVSLLITGANPNADNYGTSVLDLTTDASGDFSTGAVPPGDYVAKVSPPDNTDPGDVEAFVKVGTPPTNVYTQGAASVLHFEAATDIAVGTITLDSGATISGTVTGYAGGHPNPDQKLQNAEVTAWQGDTQVGPTVLTDVNGHYSLTGLPAGTITVKVDPKTNSGNGSAQATRTVSLSADITVDMTLPGGGTITGAVNDSNGAALNGATVSVFAPGDLDNAIATATSGPTGAFGVTGVTSGSYYVKVDPPNSDIADITGWYKSDATSASVTSFDGALVVVGNGTVQLGTFPVPRGGEIRGSVKHSGSALPDASVQLYSATHDPVGLPVLSQADGSFDIVGIDPGGYFVKVTPSEPTYSSAETPTASPIVVAAGHVISPAAGPDQRTDLDFVVQLGGSITGKVFAHQLGGATAAVSGATISVFDVGLNREAWSGSSDATTGFTAPSLPAGTYTVHITAPAGDAFDLDDAWYAGPLNPLATTASGAVSVPVNQSPVPLGNLTLNLGGSISGTVSQAASVQAYDLATPPNAVGDAVLTDVNNSNHYSITGLPAGTYNIVATPVSSSFASKQSATPISVSLGADSDAGTLTLVAGGSISGTIASHTSYEPASSSEVALLDQIPVTIYSGATPLATVYTTTGYFEAKSLPFGSYTVQVGVADSDHYDLSGWVTGTSGNYSLTTVQNSASLIAVSTQSPTSLAALTLPLGGAVTGKVTGTGAPAGLAGATVQVCNSAGCDTSFGTSATTDSGGDFAVTGVPSGGNYTVVVTPHTGSFVSATIPNVAITAGHVTDAGAIVLAVGGTLTGTITGVSGSLNGTTISLERVHGGTDGSGAPTLLYEDDPSDPITVATATPTANQSCADATQCTYKFLGLDPALHYAVFVQPTNGDEQQYIGGPGHSSVLQMTDPNALTSASFQVNAGATATVNATLIAGATITGHVVASDTQQGVLSAAFGITCTNADTGNSVDPPFYDFGAATNPSASSTDATGAFKLMGVPTAAQVGLSASAGCVLTIRPPDGSIYSPYHAQIDIKTQNLGELAVSPGATFSGVVTLPNGAPASDVNVNLINVNPDYAGDQPSTTTKPDGSYLIEGVAPDTWVVDVSVSGVDKYNSGAVDADNNPIPLYIDEYGFGSQLAYFDTDAPYHQVSGGNKVTTSFALTSGGTVTGKVTNMKGKGLAGADVAVLDSHGAGTSWDVTTASKGSYTLTRVPPGTWNVMASPADDSVNAPLTKAVVVGAGSTTTANFALSGVFATQPTPVIVGAIIGKNVTVDLGVWSPQPSKFSYQWLLNGKTIAGATKSGFKPTSAQAGQKLSVAVTAMGNGYAPATVTSAAVKIMKPFPKSGTPTVSGKAKVGSPVSVSIVAAKWSPKPTLSYQWFAGGVAIKGATKASFKPAKGLKGKQLTVRVTASSPKGYLAVFVLKAGSVAK
jgi:hypothetical protein